MSQENTFGNESFDMFYKMIEEMVDKKITNGMSHGETTEYGTVLSCNNNADGTHTISATVKIPKNGLITSYIKNNTSDILETGDSVRVTAIEGNWNNAYISLKCGL